MLRPLAETAKVESRIIKKLCTDTMAFGSQRCAALDIYFFSFVFFNKKMQAPDVVAVAPMQARVAGAYRSVTTPTDMQPHEKKA